MLKKIWIATLILFGLAALGVFLFAKDIEVVLTESTVQAAVDKKIDAGPIRSRGIELTLNSAIIDFKANDTAEIKVDFMADGFGYSGNILGDFASGIRYIEPEIFLNNIVPMKVEVSTDSRTENKIQDVKNVATDFLKRKRQEMLSEDAKQSLDSIVGRNEEAIKDFAITATYNFFESLPLYNLKNAGIKGSLASLALKDVRFTDSSAIITLSPVQALIKILSFVGLLLLILWRVSGFYIPRRDEKMVSSEQPAA